MRVTLTDLALQCGVSTMTVSKALRDSPGVAPATRAAVRRAAEELGYRPDPALSALAAHREARRARQTAPNGSKIAFLTRWKTPMLWAERDPYLAEYFAGARESAQTHGYLLENFWLHPSQLTRRRGSEILRARGIRGIILPISTNAFSHLNLAWEDFAVVMHRSALAHPRHHFISSDHFFDMRQLMHQLRKLGYRRPGLLLHERSNRYSGGCLEAAFFHELRHSHASIDHIPPLPLESHVISQAPAIRRWFRKYRPDVVIGSTSEALDLLRAAGVRVPEQAGFAAFQILRADQKIAGLDARARDAGAMTSEFLHRLLLRGELGVPELPEGILIPSRWMAGATLPEAKH